MRRFAGRGRWALREISHEKGEEPGPGRGGPPGRRGNINADEMQKHMQERLSKTTPQERARMESYRRRLMERMRQRMTGIWR